MRTLIVSDLHLGTRAGADLLRGPARTTLLNELGGVERLVLLGDTLELRQGPAREALAAARPFFDELAPLAGHMREVVLVPGNHDHALIGRWTRERARLEPSVPLGLEQRLEPAAASAEMATVAGWLGGAQVSVAYPGAWLREDVYATHGHYLDCHATVPTFERLAAGAMARLIGPLPAGARAPDDYETLLEPIYAWIDAVARRSRRALADGGSARAWRMLAGDSHRPVRARLLAGLFPLGIMALNRAGLGPLRADLSPAEIRRFGVRAMAEVVDGLAIGAAFVIFGHSHRAGPLPGDDPRLWRTPGGVGLVNSGCWVYEPGFVARGMRSPFWPGVCVELDDEGPPRLRRLLGERALDGVRRRPG